MAISKKKRKKNYKFGGFYPLYPNQLSNVPISNDNDTENDSGEVGTESKMIAKGKMIADKYKPANEQSSSKMIGQFDMATFKSLLFEMYKFMQQKYEVLQSNNNAPQIKLNHEEQSDPLCTTAHYQPDNKCITLYTNGRHIKDILRSFYHELIHHVQNLEGRLGKNIDTDEGYAQRDEYMRDLEKEAYLYGNIHFRDFEDNYKKDRKKNSVNEIKVITGDQLKNISDCTQLPSAEILKRIYKVTTQTISFNGFKQIWASDMYHDGTEWGTDSIAMINECLMAADWDAFFPAYMKFQDEALNEYNVPELFHQFIIVK